jgi:hypothetical protein
MTDALKALFNLFKPKTQSQRIEEYLSDSVSLSDLERRVRELDRISLR